jgi:hypothetical protein
MKFSKQGRAFEELQKIGAPVKMRDGEMIISAEQNDTEMWADYYASGCYGLDDFGVSEKINKILQARGLFAEWMNPGCLGVFEA